MELNTQTGLIGAYAARMRLTLALGIAALLLFIGLAVHLAPLKPGIVALQLSFDAASFQAVLSSWQAEGLALYRSHLPADFVLLLLYGAFGYRLGRHLRPGSRLFTWALPVAAVADAAENGLHLALTAGATVTAQAPYLLAGLAATAKWLAFAVFIACAVAAAVRPRAQRG